MIRKAIIATLTVGAFAIGILYVFSFSSPRRKFYPIPSYQLSVKDGKFFVGNLFESASHSMAKETPSLRRFLGFTYLRSESPSGGFAIVVIPLWIPLILFAIFPAIAFIRGPLRRYRRRRRGLCLKCGYDLTGNESGICPECGLAR